MIDLKRVSVLVALAVGAVASAQAGVLLPRDLDGNAANGFEAYYDPAQDITWMTDWRQFRDGGLNWPAAKVWADDLRLGGYDDWRLPRAGSSTCQAYQCVDGTYSPDTIGEFAYLWRIVLENKAPTLSNSGPFANMASSAYWTETPGPGVNPPNAWAFQQGTGFQSTAQTSEDYAVVGVRDGDTPGKAVPEPSTFALLALALLAAGAVSRPGSARRSC